MKVPPTTIKEQKPAMHALIDKRLRVLAILSDNLKNPHPQVVSIELIAADLQLSLDETRQLLLKMDQEGEIESDLDGRYSLITPTGLDRLDTLRHCYDA